MSTLKQQLDKDLKQALLSGDDIRKSVLRSLKSAITYAEVAKGAPDEGLDDPSILDLFKKEAKKRQESADMYDKGGRTEQAKQELSEKKIIEKYLPEQLSEAELLKILDAVSAELGLSSQTMGRVIAEVKARTNGRADGATIAKLVKERI